MPQETLPTFTDNMRQINERLAFFRKNGIVHYILGSAPIFCHAEEDLASFRFITSQLYINGSCKQSEIVTAFEVTPNSVKRSVKKLREQGSQALFANPQKAGKGAKPRVMTPEVVEKAEYLLGEGKDRKEVAKELNIKPDTLRKAIEEGRVKKNPNPNSNLMK